MTVLTDNLVAYWKLDEASGNAADSSGGGRTLTNSNVTYASTNARINNGAVFNGSSAKLVAAATASLTTLTLACWVYRTNTSNYHPLWNCDSGTGGNPSWRIEKTSNIMTFSQQGIQGLANSTGTIGATTLTHIAVTYNNSTGAYAFYINGADAGHGTITPPTWSFHGNDKIGNDGTLWMDGTVDEYGVWSRALSSAEVSTLYNGGAGLQYPFVSGPANLKSYNTNLKANIKSINGNLIANCKSLDTNS